MAKSYTLRASARARVGKGAARALRRKGSIPAVIYGDKKPAVPISLPANATSLKLRGGGFLTHTGVIEVDGEEIRVIAKDYQLDPVRDELVHVDFLRVSADSRLTVEVPARFFNEEQSPGLKRGGVLNVVRHQVELEVPADAIPERLDFDLSGLDIGDSIHISAIELPENCMPTIRDRDFTIATIAAPAGLRSEAADEVEGTVEGDESA